ALVLGVPGEAGAHLVEGHLGAFVADIQFLPGQLLALDELHHPHPVTVAEAAHHHAEGGAALALAVAGEEDHHPRLLVGGGDAGVDLLLEPLHLALVGVVVGVGHRHVPFRIGGWWPWLGPGAGCAALAGEKTRGLRTGTRRSGWHFPWARDSRPASRKR